MVCIQVEMRFARNIVNFFRLAPLTLLRPEWPVDKWRFLMLKWAAIFAVAALVLAVLGFGGLAGAAIDIAKILFWLAVIIAGALFVLGFTVYKKVT